MKALRLAAFAAVLLFPVLAQAATYAITGTITITAATCVISSPSITDAHLVATANHGLKVGTITYTSDVPCNPAPVPTISDARFVVNGMDIIVGPTDLPSSPPPGTSYSLSGQIAN